MISISLPNWRDRLQRILHIHLIRRIGKLRSMRIKRRIVTKVPLMSSAWWHVLLLVNILLSRRSYWWFWTIIWTCWSLQCIVLVSPYQRFNKSWLLVCFCLYEHSLFFINPQVIHTDTLVETVAFADEFPLLNLNL